MYGRGESNWGSTILWVVYWPLHCLHGTIRVSQRDKMRLNGFIKANQLVGLLERRRTARYNLLRSGSGTGGPSQEASVDIEAQTSVGNSEDVDTIIGGSEHPREDHNAIELKEVDPNPVGDNGR